MRPAVPPKVTGQDTACRVAERASLTLRRPETQLTSVKVLATKGRYAPSGTSPGRSGPFGAVRLAVAGESARLNGSRVSAHAYAHPRGPITSDVRRPDGAPYGLRRCFAASKPFGLGLRQSAVFICAGRRAAVP